MCVAVCVVYCVLLFDSDKTVKTPLCYHRVPYLQVRAPQCECCGVCVAECVLQCVWCSECGAVCVLHFISDKIVKTSLFICRLVPDVILI